VKATCCINQCFGQNRGNLQIEKVRVAVAIEYNDA